jgi:integrase
MASIRHRGNRQWEVRIRRKGYPPCVKTFPTKTAAEKFARDTETQMDRRVWVSNAEAEQTTLKEALERYRREITPHKKGKKQEESRIKVILRHSLALRIMATIRSMDIAEYRDQRRSARSANTVKNELILLSHVFTICQREWGMEGLRNPVELVTKPRAPRGRDRRLRPGEEELLLEALPNHYHPIFTLALETAMRLGEIIDLRWENIHRDYIRLLDTKNGEQRDVPLSTKARHTLAKLPRQLSGQVFSFTGNAVSKAFKSACDAAEIHDLRVHDLRHEAISRLFELGLNPMEVASISGHKTLQMLQRYTHLRASDLARKLG